MNYKRILTVQDISCLGQCSITVALPVISACGVETCVLPTAVLSTHTSGFKNFVCEDMSEFIGKAAAHWKSQDIRFDAIYSGYLGTVGEIDLVREIMSDAGRGGALCVVDPVMGDNGKLYPAFDTEYVKRMRSLCSVADLIAPNLTEASLLLDEPYREDYDEDGIRRLCEKLLGLGAKNVVLTGVGFEKNETGVYIASQGGASHYAHKKIPRACHGTGDLFASTLTAAVTRGLSLEKAARLAADFTVKCIENTAKEHWYGVAFEPLLAELAETLNANLAD